MLDQNQLRNPDAISRVLDDCCRDRLRMLLPDGAFLEFSKGGFPLETARYSLQLLAPYRDLVCSSRKMTELMRDELQRRSPSVTLVQDESTEFLRSLLAELEYGDDTTLRRLVDGSIAELMPPALAAWNDHDQNKSLVRGLHDGLKASMPAEQLKALRQAPEEGASNWLASANGIGFVFQGLKARGMDDETAYELTRTPSVSAGFLSALAGLAVYWLGIGGFASTAARESSGDLHDVEYIVLGALSHSLVTVDQRAFNIYRAVAGAFDTRRSLPRPAGGP